MRSSRAADQAGAVAAHRVGQLRRLGQQAPGPLEQQLPHRGEEDALGPAAHAQVGAERALMAVPVNEQTR